MSPLLGQMNSQRVRVKSIIRSGTPVGKPKTPFLAVGPPNSSLKPWNTTRTPAQTAHLPWRAVPGGAGSSTDPAGGASVGACLAAGGTGTVRLAA